MKRNVATKDARARIGRIPQKKWVELDGRPFYWGGDAPISVKRARELCAEAIAHMEGKRS